MSGNLYARYIPPTKTSTTNIKPVVKTASQLKGDAPEEKAVKLPKRPKKRKPEETSVNPTGNESDTRRSKVHQTILAKFDKSIKVSDRLREQTGTDGTQDDQLEETPIELHGEKTLIQRNLPWLISPRPCSFTATGTNQT